MGDSIYKPDVYEGGDPFLFVSCHPRDRSRVLGVLNKLDKRGFRFWMNDGVAPGMDGDEIIAEHIERCDFFIAFLSEAYLGCLDTLDELNYSRDVNKDYLLVYLDDAQLPTGLDMRFQRAESVPAYAMAEDDVFDTLLRIPDADRFYGIADRALRPRAERVFRDLEALYPEHRVFALDNVARRLSKRISALYVDAGYPSVERLLLDYGFSIISTDEARSMRSSVLYQPGFEPEIVKNRIQYIMETLSQAYPDHEITAPLQKTHKSIYSSLQGLSVWLGYDTLADMLTAYGFRGGVLSAGRPATVDSATVIRTLRERYADRVKPKSLLQLRDDNPDLKPAIKTLSNNAEDRFGMPLQRYLKSIGLIVTPESERADRKAEIRAQHIAEIRSAYESGDTDYGTFAEAEPVLNALLFRKTVTGELMIRDCADCDETMRIPLGFYAVGREAFAGRNELVTLILPPTVRAIHPAAFADCASLETIVFSEGLERIAESAFSGCTSLRSIVLPATLKTISGEAFSGCEQLSEVTFLNPRTNVQEDAFEGCPFDLSSLGDAGASPAEFFDLKVDRKNNGKILRYTGDEETVVVPAMIGGHPIVSIEKGAFKDNATVREVFIHDSIAAVTGDVFKNCTRLEKVHLPDAVTALTATIFSGCTSLREVNIPNAMTEIQRGLFKDAPLKALHIGRSVQRVSPDAFNKGQPDFATGLCFKSQPLESITVDADNPNFTVEGTMLLSRDGKHLYAELGDPVCAEIPEGVEDISDCAFDRIGALKEVRLPASLKVIGAKAFAGTNLQRVELPNAVETVGTQAFSFCRSLTAAELNDGLRVIGDQAFEGCPIAEVFVPASVETLGVNSFLAISAFQGQGTQTFRIDSANTHYRADGVALYQLAEDGAVLVRAYDPALRQRANEPAVPVTYRVAEDTVSIEAQAFVRCGNLAAITLPEGMRSIGDMAFMDCAALRDVQIPSTCSEIAPRAFFGSGVTIG